MAGLLISDVVWIGGELEQKGEGSFSSTDKKDRETKWFLELYLEKGKPFFVTKIVTQWSIRQANLMPDLTLIFILIMSHKNHAVRRINKQNSLFGGSKTR